MSLTSRTHNSAELYEYEKLRSPSDADTSHESYCIMSTVEIRKLKTTIQCMQELHSQIAQAVVCCSAYFSI